MIAGGAAISLTGVLVRYAHVPPTVSGFWRMAFGGALLTLSLVALRQWRRMRWSDALWMLPPALAFAADLFIWHRSIRDVGPGLATLLANLQVFIMALAGVLLHRERLGPRFLIGLALAFGGLGLLVGRAWGTFGAAHRRGVQLGGGGVGRGPGVPRRWPVVATRRARAGRDPVGTYLAHAASLPAARKGCNRGS